jgi:hypothetical protein
VSRLGLFVPLLFDPIRIARPKWRRVKLSAYAGHRRREAVEHAQIQTKEETAETSSGASRS